MDSDFTTGSEVEDSNIRRNLMVTDTIIRLEEAIAALRNIIDKIVEIEKSSAEEILQQIRDQAGTLECDAGNLEELVEEEFWLK